MRNLCVVFLLCVAAWGQSTQNRVIHVWLDTDVWTQGNLLTQLNNAGKSKHFQFVAAAPGETYDYKIHYEQSANSLPLSTGGSLPTHVGLVVVTDTAEQEMVRFNVADRLTEKHLSNAAAKEIVKRLAVVLGK